MAKIKVLQYPAPLAKGGGVSQYILNSFRFIDKSRFQLDFLTFSKERLDVHDEFDKQGCKIHYLSCRPDEDIIKLTDELHTIFDESYDAIHIHTSYWTGFLFEEIAAGRNIPIIIVHSHSTNVDMEGDEKRRRAVEIHEQLRTEFNTGLATHFCACSHKAADWLFGEQIPRDKIIIVNNAVDVDKFHYNPIVRDEYRKKLGIENSFVMGHVGRFCYSKNHDMLAELFNAIRMKLPNAKLLLAGIGELEDDIKKKVTEYGLSEDVLFLGYRTDVAKLMQAMDVFLLPSRFEGSPITLVEAQCTGLPCFACEAVPAEAKLTANLEFLPFDIGLWVERIIDFADSGYIRKSMANEITDAGFSIKRQVEALERIYAKQS
jgi:glycosyltransferase involved in cell wall biosynthesis